jgi:hypothetical protein
MFEEPEQYFTVRQIAKNRNLSADTIRRLFIDEPGVIVITKPKHRRRTYRVLRVPESVERRVFERLTNS